MTVDPPAAPVRPHDAPAAGQLAKHFVCRVGGLPVGALEGLRANASVVACGRLLEIEKKLKELQDGLTEGLYQSVNGLEDRQLRRRLLKLKRAIHNLRALSQADLSAVAGILPEELALALRRFDELGQERRQAHARLQVTFAGEVLEIRHRFQALVEDEDFKKGLLLSSRTLSDELERYTRATMERPGSKVRQIERSLLRYFSRMVMKATPFGTFCAIVPGSARPEHPEDEQPTFLGDPGQKRSHLRLNKSLLAILLLHLTKRPGVRRYLHVEQNPTLGEEQGRWLFLAAKNGIEVFQRLDKNPVIDLLRQHLENGAHVPLNVLLRELTNNPEIDATEEEAATYVDRLLEIGIFRFRIGIAEQEVDWDLPLCNILQPLADDHAKLVAGFLEQLRGDMEAYAEAPSSKRRGLIESAIKRMRFLFEELGAGMQPSAEMPPFYEDAAGQAALHIPTAGIAQPLAEYVGLTSRLSWQRGEQASIRHFFDTYYGPDPPPVPLLRFYEEFYREHFKAHLERQRSAGKGHSAAAPPDGSLDQEADGESAEVYDLQNPFQLELIETLRTAHEALADRLRELWQVDPEAQEITLTEEDLTALVTDVPTPPEPCRSVSVFGQYLPGFAPDGGPALVANGYLNGYGKYFSRHLYLLPEEVQQDLRSSNLRLTDQEMAEICGDASFNANLHPPLFAWEVSYPTGESGASDKQIRSSDLYVEPDPHNPFRLCLRHGATGKQVIPVDLGFLNPRMRPPLYQLLSRFTPPASFHLQIPESAHKPATSQEPVESSAAPAEPSSGVYYRPRVTYRGRLVLARRRWWVSPDTFPKRQPQESEADYFLHVWHWREKLGLPTEVFMRVQSLPTPPRKAEEDEATKPSAQEEKVGPEDTAQAKESKPTRSKRPPVRKHLYKPQYIDFRNPLLVDLFSRTTENLDNYVITLEERLPAKEHLPALGEDRYATEFVLQVDFRGGSDND